MVKKSSRQLKTVLEKASQNMLAKSLERLMYDNYKPAPSALKMDNYLIKGLVHYKWAEDIVERKSDLADLVYDQLKSLPHRHRSEGLCTVYDEDFSQVAFMSTRQLFRVYLMLDNLKSRKFVKGIGRMIDADLGDPYNEHGGIVTLDSKGMLEFEFVPSNLTKERKKENNGTYEYDEKLSAKKHVFLYHQHATQSDDGDFAGPSSGVPVVDEGDLQSTEADIRKYGEMHEVVITKLKGQRFNIDYFGGEKRGCLPFYIENFRFVSPIRLNVLDLGIYSYA